ATDFAGERPGVRIVVGERDKRRTRDREVKDALAGDVVPGVADQGVGVEVAEAVVAVGADLPGVDVRRRAGHVVVDVGRSVADRRADRGVLIDGEVDTAGQTIRVLIEAGRFRIRVDVDPLTEAAQPDRTAVLTTDETVAAAGASRASVAG